MFGDAQVLFYDEKSISRQFSYAAIRRMVTKDMSGIHFAIVYAATKKPLKTVVITSAETEEALPLNNRGILNLRRK